MQIPDDRLLEPEDERKPVRAIPLLAVIVASVLAAILAQAGW
jgi:hypothetical protein